MRYLLMLISSITLFGCGGHKLLVHNDKPTLIDQQRSKIEINVPSVHTRYVLNELAFNLSIGPGVNQSNSNSTFVSEKDMLTNISYYGPSIKGYEKSGWTSEQREFLINFTKQNHNLNDDDITNFEFKIIGMESGIETVANKRFNGQIKQFNWVELFTNRVPYDKTGYLFTAKVAINYVPIFINPNYDDRNRGNSYKQPEIEKDDKKYFTVFPVKITRGTLLKKISYNSEYEPYVYCAFSNNNPDRAFSKFAEEKKWNVKKAKKYWEKRQYNFTSAYDLFSQVKRNYSDDSYCIDKAENAANLLFNDSSISIKGTTYRHFYVLNDKYVQKYNMNNNSFHIKEVQKSRLKQSVLYDVYSDEFKAQEVNKNLLYIRTKLNEAAIACKSGQRRGKSLSKIKFRQKDKYYYYIEKLDHEGKGLVTKKNYYISQFKKYKSEFDSLVNKSGGADISVATLNKYDELLGSIAEISTVSGRECRAAVEQLNNIVNAEVNDTSKSFLSILGGVVKNEYDRSVNSNTNTSRYSSSNTSNTLGYTWKDIHENLNQSYQNAINNARKNKARKRNEYQQVLQIAQQKFQQTGKIPLSRTERNLAQECVSKGGKYNSLTRNCFIFKQYNTVTLTKTGVNSVYGNKQVPGTMNYSGRSSGNQNKKSVDSTGSNGGSASSDTQYKEVPDKYLRSRMQYVCPAVSSWEECKVGCDAMKDKYPNADVSGTGCGKRGGSDNNKSQRL